MTLQVNQSSKEAGNPTPRPFPAGGGETGALIRAFDWSRTSLGPTESWPQSLKTALDLVLQSPVPMVMLWGPEGIMLYNDPYSVFAGRRHPRALGAPVLEGWPEVADFNRRVMEVGLGGGTLSFQDQHLILYRNGVPEDVWMDLNYSPILDENHRPAGVLAVVVETTERVRAQRDLERRDEQLRLAQEAGGIGMFDLDIATDVLTVTPEFCRIYGLPPQEASPAETVQRLVLPDDRTVASSPRTRADGTARTAVEYRIARSDTGEVRWISRKAKFVYDEAGRPARFIGAVQDVTDRKQAEEALRISQERLLYALGAAGMVGTWDWHIPSDTIYADAKFAEMFSVDPDLAAPGTNRAAFKSRIHPEDRQRVDEATQRAIETGEKFSEEYRLPMQDGTLRWVLAQGECLYDGEGKPLRFPGAVVDVTDRKRSEEALRESEARFRLMANSAPVLIWATDAQGEPVFVNRRHHRELGLTLEGIRRGEWRRVVYREDADSFRDAFVHALSTGSPFHAEVRVWDRRGRLRWLRCEGVPRRDSEGRFLGYVGCNVDITEARHAADALEAQVEQRTRELNSIWRVSRDLFCICGFDGYYQSVNPAWTEALGYQAHELIGRQCLELVHPEDVPRAEREFERLRSTDMVETDLRVRARDGSYRWYNWTSVAEGDVFYAAGRDVTARKELEEQLRQSQKMEAIGQLTGGIAHDFNNLLTGIIGSLELLQARIAQGRYEKVARYAEGAIAAAGKAAALTHRLLAFARRQPLDPRPVNVNQLVASMEDLIRRTTGEAIRVEFETQPDLWWTRCDPNQLENALLNLVINARDAMPDGGRLTIATSNVELGERELAAQGDAAPGQYVVLRVTDTGVGMAPDVRDRAFDPFFTTKPLGQGTGLGLSMIYGFAKQSEGHVRIHSEVGEGTTVRIYLPRHDGHVEEESPSGTAEAPRSGTGEVVLVVEDDPTVRSLIVEVLAELGYEALQAHDGPSGLRCLESDRHIDLLVTDVGLPGLNGRQLADAARQKRPGLKILFITGYAESAALASGFLDPGMEMITKPFAVENLAERIRGMIELAPELE
ncbi:PAS domain S-box protein [Microvirga thermotolerans]|uniref:histidine kinase n=1 Tax=Microvirga thermotolerans TaxID=2651334 RepID=A0A5P9JRW4_9HYPH|nr:PAS domain S-box protein [Microvirga thermotolerans]QFU15512.1 PAS domain S-box protein [Microvirga thermotolerans]